MTRIQPAAGTPGGGRSERSRHRRFQLDGYTDVNTRGTAVLLEALAEGGIHRLLVASSMSIYGEGLYQRPDGSVADDVARTREQLLAGEWDPGAGLPPLPTPEWKTPRFSSVYALTKYDQERMCCFGGPPTTCRPWRCGSSTPTGAEGALQSIQGARPRGWAAPSPRRRSDRLRIHRFDGLSLLLYAQGEIVSNGGHFCLVIPPTGPVCRVAQLMQFEALFSIQGTRAGAASVSTSAKRSGPPPTAAAALHAPAGPDYFSL